MLEKCIEPRSFSMHAKSSRKEAKAPSSGASCFFSLRRMIARATPRTRTSLQPPERIHANRKGPSESSTYKSSDFAPSTQTSYIASTLMSKCRENDGADDRPEVSYQCLIQSCSWSRMQKNLQSESGIVALRNEPLVLHRALRHHAPLDIILLLLTHKPSCLDEIDAYQRNALHIAAMSRSQVETVDLLLKQRRKLSSDVDRDGRTPLHLLLTAAGDISDDNKPHKAYTRPTSILDYRMMSFHRTPSKNVIQLLVQAAPNTLNLEDECQMSPIELVILSRGIHLQTIQDMRNRSVKQWKKMERMVLMPNDHQRHCNEVLPSNAGAIRKYASRSASMDTCNTVGCTTDDENDEDEEIPSTCSSGDSPLCRAIPLGSRRGKQNEQDIIWREKNYRPQQRRVSKHAITA